MADGVSPGESLPPAAETGLEDPYWGDREEATRPIPDPPLRHLINHHADILDPHDRASLERLLEDTDLVELKYQIADLQGNLIESARQRGIVTRQKKTNAAYLNPPARINREMRAFQHESTNQTKRAS